MSKGDTKAIEEMTIDDFFDPEFIRAAAPFENEPDHHLTHITDEGEVANWPGSHLYRLALEYVEDYNRKRRCWEVISE